MVVALQQKIRLFAVQALADAWVGMEVGFMCVCVCVCMY
jgi:hypothetical protein